MGDGFDPWGGRKEPDSERIDRLLPRFGPMADIIEMSNLRPGPEPLKILAACDMWAERIQRQSRTPENPEGRTYLFKAIQSAYMRTMASRGRRSEQLLHGLIGAHRDEVADVGYGELAPGPSPRRKNRPAKQLLRDEMNSGLEQLDKEAGDL